MDATMVGAVSGGVVAICVLLGFWMKFSDRITKAETDSTNALLVAAEAEASAKEANDRATTGAASMSLYREQAIEKFVTHHAITELERRLVESQEKTEARLVDALEGLNRRLDRLIEAGLAKIRGFEQCS